MATLVKFLVNERVDKDEVFAFFPQLNYNKNFYGNMQKTSYSHIGQHSPCRVDHANESRKATYEEYKDLLTELLNIGYDLKICK
jgi:hypothetical protein